LLCADVAQAQSEQTQSQAQAPSSSTPAVANAYRGTIVCERAPGAVDILRVPLDLAVRGDTIQFARPLFNPRGTRVLGSELGAGSIDGGGKAHLTSTWDVRGIVVHGDYSGTLTPHGGTLTGTQSWRLRDGDAHSRVCQIALAPAAGARQAKNE
jgi:hypothetical protein